MKRNLLRAWKSPSAHRPAGVWPAEGPAKQFDFKEVSSQVHRAVLMAALGLPMGDEAIVDEQTVRDNAVLMVQSDARTRAKGPEHIAAYNWMQDYAAKVIAMRRAAPRNDLISNFSAGRDRRRPARRPRGAADHHHADHGRRGVLGGFMMMFAYNLATFGDARRAVVANPALLPDAIEESLRFNTSAQRFPPPLMKDVTCMARP
jgi:cytochrome P450